MAETVIEFKNVTKSYKLYRSNRARKKVSKIQKERNMAVFTGCGVAIVTPHGRRFFIVIPFIFHIR